jgi:Ca-activated chloride channel family protein
MRRSGRWAAQGLAVAVLLSGCTLGDDVVFPDEGGTEADPAAQDPGDCIVVDMAVSSEKIDLMRDLAQEYNGSDEARVDDRCVFVRPQSKASGGAAQLLSSGWDEAVEGPRPVVWSPASSAWGAVVNQRLESQGEDPIVGEARPFMQTPLVIAMPRPMADALGYPDEPIGWADVLELARSDEGWAAFGHPEWGAFRLGKTNPNFSTSGLSALIAQNYAAVGKTRGLTIEDLDRPDVQQFAQDVESAVVHYGDTTLTFGNNWYRNDARGTALTYVSAVAMEEVSIVQYNRGNPDGVLQPGEVPEEPRDPLVAIYPEEGTLFSDNPYIVLDADWVDEDEAAAAALFEAFVQRPENQERVLEFGFRPGNIEVPIGDPITSANGVDPDQPQTTLAVPDPAVLVEMIDRWETQRKPARVLLVMDVSGSMGDPAGGADRATKLDLAKEAAITALEQFAPQDAVGLRIFSSEIGPDDHPEYVDLVPIEPIGQSAEALRTRIRQLVPTNGTPLYTVTQASYDQMVADYDPAAINAVVLLTDGRNEDVNDDLAGLLASLQAGSEGSRAQPVRVFTIAYGQDADQSTMERIAESTDAADYDASDPASIDKVFTSVISNF